MDKVETVKNPSSRALPWGARMLVSAKSSFIAVAATVTLLAAPSHAATVSIDGTITAGEWTGATAATIGNGGGTAFFFADTSYVYGAFDITGWTSALGAGSIGNLLGFGVCSTNNSYPGDCVEFQQSTLAAAWGGDGISGTMNGLLSAFRLDAQSPPAVSIPGDLQAMDSFATGHRVWEVRIPISSMAIVGDTVWVVGGINYDAQQHWYPDTVLPSFVGYLPVSVSPVPLPAAAWLMLTGLGGLGAMARRKSGA
jgi:hypothetical protein